MVNDFNELIVNMQKEKISGKSLINIINLNGFNKEKVNKLMETILESPKYSKLLPRINNNLILKYLDIKLEESDYKSILRLINYSNSKFNLKLIKKLIIDNEIDYICIFANRFNKEDKKLLLDMLLETKDDLNIYLFARNVKNIDIQKLEDAIVDLGNESYLYYFARDIKNANLERLENKLIEVYQEETTLVNFAELNDSDINKLEDLILKSNNPYTIMLYASNPRSNLLKIEKKLIELGNLESLLELAKLSRMGDLTDLENYFLLCNNHYYIYKLASDLKNKVNVLNLEMALLKCPNEDIFDSANEETISKSYSIYSFANDLSGYEIDMSLLEDSIIESNNYYYIYKFYKDVKNCNHDKLRKKLLEFKSEVELDILDYKNRNDSALNPEDYINFVDEILGIKLPNFTMAFNLIRNNLLEIIEKIGLVHLYLRLDNRYFKVKEEVLERVSPSNKDLFDIYSSFLKGDMSLELALELDKRYLNRNTKKELKKVR